MSTEPNNNEQNNESSQTDQWNNTTSEDLLKTRVESEHVVNFIENMVQAMGAAAAGHYGGTLPQNQIRRQQIVEQSRKYQSKTVNTIMKKLERVERYPDTAKDILKDETVNEWLNHNGCKQKEYFEELECAQELTGFYGGHRYFDHAVKAASKAVNITMLHRREDLETLAELYWVLAELHAATDKMDVSMDYMRKCLALMEPDADESHPTYKELLGQLEETRQRSLMVVPA
jgi:hypothetical protein